MSAPVPAAERQCWAAETEDFRSLGELVDRCDVLTLHVPLTEDGPHPTRGLLDRDGAAALTERFEGYLAFDPANVETYLERTHQLLPRWHGSYAELEHFARQSADRTQDQWGLALYMMIYCVIADTEPLDQTHMDWPLILDGFDDAIFPQRESSYNFVEFDENGDAIESGEMEGTKSLLSSFETDGSAVPKEWQ